MNETIFQNFIFKEFVFPFLLIFTVVFAILEKTKIFGDDKKQLDAIVAFVIGLIFVSFAYPKNVVENLILFLTVAIIVAFVALLLWGFVMGEEAKIPSGASKAIKWTVGVVIAVAVLVALVWAMGLNSTAFDFLFKQSWSNVFWTNLIFVVVIVVAIALVIRKVKD